MGNDSIQSSKLNGITLNGASAVNVARLEGKNNTLETIDLITEFRLTKREAKLLMEHIQANANKKRHIRFGQLPVRIANRCADPRLQPRAAFPQASCLAIDINTGKAQKHSQLFAGWSAANARWLSQWYGFATELANPETKVAVFDYDDTLVPNAIGPKVFRTAVAMGKVTFPANVSKRTLDGANYVREKLGLTWEQFDQRVKDIKDPYQWWRFLADNTFLGLEANYANAAGFGGLTIGDLHAIVLETKKQYPDLFSKGYPEMIRLVNDMNAKNLCTAVVSSSNFVEVAFGLHANGYKVPLHAVQGTDFYVVHPGTGKHVLFSDLVNTDLLHKKPSATIVEALATYKDVRIVSLADHITNAGEGKGASANSIVDRHVVHRNRQHPEDPITRSDMRLVGYFGDSSHPRSDLPGSSVLVAGPSPVQGGNDQGLLRTVRPDQYFAVVNMDRGIGRPDGTVDYRAKGSKIVQFDAMVRELLRVTHGIPTKAGDTVLSLRAKYPLRLQHFNAIHQRVISRGPGIGTFDNN